MRRIAKILTLSMMLALLVACFVVGSAVSTSAAETKAATRSGQTTGYDYTNTNGEVVWTEDLQEAFTYGASNTTIYVNGDETYTFGNDHLHIGHFYKNSSTDVNYNNQGGPFTLDLDGHTLTFVQNNPYNYVSLGSQKMLTVKNGTIKVGMVGEGIPEVEEPTEGEESTTPDPATAYPLFRYNWGSAKLTLENVNTYSGGIAIIAGKSASAKGCVLNVIGGNHYVTTNAGDRILNVDPDNKYAIGAFLDARNGITANISDAKFYLGENNYLLNDMSYSDATATSLYSITNCEIVASGVDKTIISYSNKLAIINFEATKIYGSVNPARCESDAALGLEAITKNEITYFHMTEWVDGATMLGTVDGTIKDAESEVTSLPLLVDDVRNGANGVYVLTGETVTYTLNKRAYVNAEYEIVSPDGKTSKFLPYGTEFSAAVAEVAAGGTLRLVSDAEVTGKIDTSSSNPHKTYLAIIDKEMTIDLNGFTLAVKQVRESPSAGRDYHEQRIGIKTSAPVTVEGGTIICKSDSGNQNYPLFTSEGYNINLTFNDIDTYMGALAFVWRGPRSVITINGGTHNILYRGTGSPEGYISALDNITFNANNATFFVSDEFNTSARLLGFGNNSTEASTGYYATDVTFTNCNIISAKGVSGTATVGSASAGSLFTYANAHTNIVFNNSRVFGTTNTANNFNGNATNAAIDEGSIRYGYNTKVVLSQVRQDGVAVADRGSFNTIDGGYTATFTVGRFLYEDIFSYDYRTEEFEITVSFDTYVNASNVFEILDERGNHYEFVGDTYNKDGSIATRATFYNAINRINEIGAGYTLKLLGDYLIDGRNEGEGEHVDSNNSYFARFKVGTTVDLNGFTLTMHRGTLSGQAIAGQEKLSLEARAVNGERQPITFKNGKILTADRYAVSEVYAIFFVQVDNSELILDDVDTYSGGIIYSFNASCHVTINGGEHQSYVNMKGAQSNGASMTFRNAFTLTATDAKFYLDNYNRGLFSVNAQSEAIANKMTGLAVFNNCDILMYAIHNQGQLPTESIISDYNGATTTYFNGCRLYGSINPVKRNAFDPEIKDYSVIFGTYNGVPTEWATEGALFTENLIHTEAGYAPKAQQRSETVTFKGYTRHTDPTTYKWNFKNITYNVKYDMVLAEGYTVEWYLYDSTEPYFVSSVLAGETAKVPTVIPETTDINNGWYKLTHTGGWTFDMFGAAEELVITKDSKVYPAAILKAHMTSLKYNINLMGHVGLFLYVPTEIPAGVTITSATSDGTFSGAAGIIDGVACTRYSLGSIGCTDIAKDRLVTFVLNVQIAGTTVELTQKVTISPIRYARQVLSSTTGSLVDARTVMADMMRYSYAVSDYCGYYNDPDKVKSQYKAIKELYEAYEDVCSPINESYFNYDNSLVNVVSSLGNYIEWATFEITNYQPRFRVKFKESAKVVSAKFEIVEGWKVSGVYNESGANWSSNVRAEINAGWGTSHYAADGSGTTVFRNSVCDDYWNYSTSKPAVAGKYLHIVCPDNMAIYNIDKLIRITVTYEKEDGSTATAEGIYNLREYYNNLMDNQSIDETTRDRASFVIEAMKAYSDSAAGYRFGPAKDEEGYVSHGRINGYEIKNS